MGAELMRTHFSFDPLRFMDPGADPEAGYAWFLGRQIHEDEVAIFVAELDGEWPAMSTRGSSRSRGRNCARPPDSSTTSS